jgi:hypothetical protein
MDSQKLSKIFNEFVGQPMKDPRRFTDDLCPVMYKVDQIAGKNGLEVRVILSEPGQLSDNAIMPNRVTVVAEKSGDSVYPYRVKKIGLY